MEENKKYGFSAIIKIIGINPYVSVPEEILKAISNDANKDKGPIPINGTVNDKPYLQTLVKYSGEWRLYINTIMLNNSPKRIGENITITIAFDPKERKIEMHSLLKKALTENQEANAVFEKLSPYRQKEIIRYISHLKTEEKIKENVTKAINFLLGKEKFAGREKP
ncbi:YdeI/OmpD-associated family protein [Flavobacterium sp.]|uniref:YdeI/OmpD-associated family protein n=1 Tax=Flavobacterium sp. TaxID=239 RepID=UPI002629C7FD|nr:YdeI/OmpD-associated family protein [Flavobacterium sp.]